MSHQTRWFYVCSSLLIVSTLVIAAVAGIALAFLDNHVDTNTLEGVSIFGVIVGAAFIVVAIYAMVQFSINDLPPRTQNQQRVDVLFDGSLQGPTGPYQTQVPPPSSQLRGQIKTAPPLTTEELMRIQEQRRRNQTLTNAKRGDVITQIPTSHPFW